ncbi:MAG TPA: phosphatase PAP2 family protein [Aquella sp.]|nr:phosphatase PAP2 family protein [Aquella sp.]
MLCPLKSCKKNGCHCIKDYGLFVSFVILALAIWIFKLNQPLFQYINSLHSLLPNIVWKGLNLISYSKFFILPLLLLVITFIWRKDRIKQVIALLIAYYLVFQCLKMLFGEARPYMVLPEGSFFWINQFENVAKSAYRSFPSGHTGNMAVFVFALSSIFDKKWLKVLLFLLLILTGLARICTGWHWPLDVIASGLISYILVQICLYRKYTGPI